MAHKKKTYCDANKTSEGKRVKTKKLERDLAIAHHIYAETLKKQNSEKKKTARETAGQSEQASNNTVLEDNPAGADADKGEETAEEEDEEDEDDKEALDKEFDQHQAKLGRILAMVQEANPEKTKKENLPAAAGIPRSDARNHRTLRNQYPISLGRYGSKYNDKTECVLYTWKRPAYFLT